MPEVDAASVVGGPVHTRRSHRFFGDKDEGMLRNAINATLTITPDRNARFSITNDRVGHLLPSGGNWVSVQLRATALPGAC